MLLAASWLALGTGAPAVAQAPRVLVDRPTCEALASSHDGLLAALELELASAGLTTLGEAPAVHRVRYDATPCGPAPREVQLHIDDAPAIAVDLEAAAARARERSLALLMAELLREAMAPPRQPVSEPETLAAPEPASAAPSAEAGAPLVVPNLMSAALDLGAPAPGVAATSVIAAQEPGAESDATASTHPWYRISAAGEVRGHGGGEAYGVGARVALRLRPPGLPGLALIADLGGYRSTTGFGLELATVTGGAAVGPAFDVGPVELFVGPRVELGASYWRNPESSQLFEWSGMSQNALTALAGLSARGVFDLVGRLAVVVGVDIGAALRAPRYGWYPPCPEPGFPGECEFWEVTLPAEESGLGGFYWNVQLGLAL